MRVLLSLKQRLQRLVRKSLHLREGLRACLREGRRVV